MCGILITKQKDRINSISHRGTEFGIESLNDRYLVHHRLPIQTLDGDEWSMPYKIGANNYLMFNGEIFNYDTDKFGSDTEYLVSFFKDMHVKLESLVPKLKEINTWDGFWAIVLYDSFHDRIISFTDPLGKKQLYINNDGEVCSEINPLINEKDSLDEHFLGTVRKFGYNHDNRTPWKNIKRLLPDSIHEINLRDPRLTRTYPNIKLEPTNKGNIKELLTESVKRRLLSKNYPISVLLSGGLDSTIITSILEAEGADVTYYTIDNGEDKYVKICEEYFGIKVKRLSYNLKDDTLLQKIYCEHNETPIDLGSVVPQYHLFDAIKSTGHRIVLSGDGADELFGGYRRIDHYDSQKTDIFDELTYYHLPRLDRMSMAHTIELRNPFLGHDVVRYALGLSLEERTHKKILKEAFRGSIPNEIIDRKKEPLKNESIKENKLEYRTKVLTLFKKRYNND